MIAGAVVGVAIGFATAWYWRGQRDRCDRPVTRNPRPKLNLSALDDTRPNRRR